MAGSGGPMPGLVLSRRKLEEHQDAVITLLYLCLCVVLLNALSVVVVFWIKASGHFAGMPWSTLAQWALGSGGLGAGGLLFKTPLDRLFGKTSK